jgi:pilus assembly protein CpaC
MKKIFLIALLLLGAITLLPLNNFALDQMGEEIKLYVGQVKTVSVNNPTRIVIGNPSVADVGSVSKREVTLSPKSAGMTTLVIWDNFGENSYTVRVFAENMSEYKRRIDNILKKLNLSEVVTKAEDEEGKVYMTGSVRSAKDREQMLTALGGLKDKTLDLTRVKEDDTIVEIDVQVLELNKGATDTLGFTWPGSATFNITDASVATTGAGNFANLFTINKWLRDPLSFTLQVDFLIQEGKARILSRPRLSCQSGKARVDQPGQARRRLREMWNIRNMASS